MGTAQCCSVERHAPPEKDPSDVPPISLQGADGKEVTDPKGAKPSPKASAKGRGKEVLQRMKGLVTKHMDNIKELRSFLKKHFKSPGEAWTVIAADVAEGELLQEAVFVKKMQELGFEGNAGALFSNTESKGEIAREEFVKNLSGGVKDSGFLALVEQAVADKKAKKAEVASTEAEEVEVEASTKTSPRGRARSTKSSPRGSSPRASSPKGRRKSRDSSPKGARVQREGARASSPKEQGRRNSNASVASISTAASTPTGNNDGNNYTPLEDL